MKALWRQKQTSARCSQSWEVEAARDGRLAGASLDTLARHVEQCAECQELSRYFAGLGRKMRDLDGPRIDDIAVRRLRQKILGSVDAEMAGRTISPLAKRHYRLIALIAAFAVVVALVTLKQTRPPLSSGPSKTTTTVDATDEGGARWTRTTSGDVEWIDLSDGTLRLRVQRAPGSRRVVVRVPDGEIEDLGTTFHVVVSHGRTQRVGVDEGRVTIRLTYMAPITISSGASWERPEEPAPAPMTTSASSMPSIDLSPSTSPSKRTHVAPLVRHAEPPEWSPDAAKEDAAYLHTISLLREGRSAEAKSAARDYLKRFPDGFRREEMARIAE